MREGESHDSAREYAKCRHWWQAWRKRVFVLPICLLFWFILHTVVVTLDGVTDEIAAADVIVVLGNAVTSAGQPAPRLQARLDRAIRLYTEKRAPLILVSGGVGVAGLDEATVMRDYLVRQKIPSAAVLVDSTGVNTRATAWATATLLRQRGWQSVIAVTHYYHISRTRLALRQEGVAEIYSAHAAVHLELREPYAWLREFVGYYFYWLRLR